MSTMKQLYVRSGWHSIFNLTDQGAKARSSLLAATIVQGVVGGFSGGIFYTGLLVGYGINIVNISIITVVPYIASLFTLFAPYILERFPQRRVILSVTRVAYYTVNILGITLLPQAGVALGMSVTVAQTLGADGAMVRNIVLFGVLIYELVGPALTRIALTEAGDIQPKAEAVVSADD